MKKKAASGKEKGNEIRLEVRAPDPVADREAVVDLVSKTFGNYFPFRKHVEGRYMLGGPYDWRASRVGLIDGRMVTHFGVWDYGMRIGGAVVRCGGIGVVSTHGDYRKKGYMERTVEECLGGMRDLGYDMTVLFGIWDFYHRFGYTRAWAETHLRTKLDRLPEKGAGKIIGKLRPVKPPLKKEIRDRLDTLFNRQFAACTGTAVHPMYEQIDPERQWFVWGSDPAKAGGIEGYIAIRDHGQRLEVSEYADAEGRTEQVLNVCGALARKLGAEEVSFSYLPWTCDLARWLRRHHAWMEREYIHSGGPMARVVNLASTLEKMCGEFQRRLQGSCLEHYRGTLTIRYRDEQTARLTIADGTVRVTSGGKETAVLDGGDALTQLLLGTDEPLEIVDTEGITLRGDARQLLPVLFPAQWPTLHAMDRY